ncbi:glycosyltransferase family 4 protein [Collimonas pratensis]|uniref:Glycosyl transferases group 1 family protein n=1 Tax=Collimonas pratensis TaxID=279113 RepID=A0A127PZZ7_9BURK|nr:glycosyltransferase family 4 protein [Collimonas pratensis]AMP03326.1 glycosyl transferases group 1 family protein [Collimonas pratensis]
MSKEIYILSTPRIFGGSEIFQIKLAALLQHHLHLTIVSPPLPPLQNGLADWGAQFVELPAHGRIALRWAFLHWLWQQRRVLRADNTQIVLNGRGAAYWAPLVRLLVGYAPTIISHTELSLKYWDLKERLYGVAVRNARRVIAVSETVAAQHRHRWPKTAVLAIPNWIDSAITTRTPHPQSGLAISLNLAVVGRLAPGKGIEDAVIACGGLQDLELHIYGDGPLHDDLGKMAHQMSWLHLHGHVDDLAQRLPTHAILLSCSHSESFSYSVAEGIQAGLLCVISDIPAHRELLGQDYPESLLFPVGNLQALQNSLRAAREMLTRDNGTAASEAVNRARARIRIRNAPDSARISYLTVLAAESNFSPV